MTYIFTEGLFRENTQWERLIRTLLVLRESGLASPTVYMPISAVGLFCCDKFEKTPNEEVVNTSKLTINILTIFV